MARHPNRNMMNVRMGGAAAKATFWEELTTAVARPRSEGLNDSRIRPIAAG